MGLIRYLLIGVLIYLAALLVRRFLRGSMQISGKDDKADSEAGLATVRCAHCGLFLPKTQALHSGDAYFCDEEHRQASLRNE